ncbi:MAG: hypothetical protein Q9173_005343 [Seirophora scorigena]
MATNEFQKALADVESLLRSRKGLAGSNVPLAGLDILITRRLSSAADRIRGYGLQLQGPLLLSQITHTRKEMESLGFDLAAVDEVASRFLDQMCRDERVEQKVLHTARPLWRLLTCGKYPIKHEWSVPILKYLTGKNVMSSNPPNRYLFLVPGRKQPDSQKNPGRYVTIYQVVDGNDTPDASDTSQSINASHINYVSWAPSTNKLRIWTRDVDTKNFILEMFCDGDARKLISKIREDYTKTVDVVSRYAG